MSEDIKVRLDSLQNSLAHLSERIGKLEDRVLELEEKAVNIDLRMTKSEAEAIRRSFCKQNCPYNQDCDGCPINNILYSLKQRREALFKRLESIRKEKKGG